MFAEQHRHTHHRLIHAEHRFSRQTGRASLDSHYHTQEHKPLRAYIEDILRSFRPGEQIEHLNLGRSFGSVLRMIEKGDTSSEALRKKLFTMALDLWSLRQEVTGEKNTIEVVTPVYKDGNGFRFRSDLRNTQDLDKMFEESLYKQDKQTGRDIVPDTHKPRHRREHEQIKRRYTTATKPLEQIDLSLPEDELCDQLKAHGFVKQTIPLTPGIIAGVPSIRASIDTMSDLIARIDQQETVTVWVGPAHHLTISPPHWIHAKGKTSFVWNTQLVVLPSTKETWMSEHGFFSHTPLTSLLPVLTWKQPEDKVFSSEDELMQCINTIMGYSSVHPSVLLREIITTLDGYSPAPKMDENVVEGPFSIRQYIHTIENLFKFELSRCETDPRFKIGSYERLQFMADKIKHLVALNDSQGLPELLSQYQQTYSTLDAATHPQKAFNLLNQFALHINPKFGIKLNWSLFDCVIGTPTSLLQKVDVNVKAPGAEVGALMRASNGELFQLTSKQAELLRQYPRSSRGRRIKTETERDEFCKAFDLNPQQFHTYGQCSMCGQETFVWSPADGGCNACPVCQKWDDYKDFDMIHTQQSPSTLVDRKITSALEKRPLSSISKFFSSVFTPSALLDEQRGSISQIYEALSLIQEVG